MTWTAGVIIICSLQSVNFSLDGCLNSVEQVTLAHPLSMKSAVRLRPLILGESSIRFNWEISTSVYRVQYVLSQ